MWNYRIIDFGTHLALHEVHYADGGAPRAYTAEPASFVADPGEASDIAGALAMALADAKDRPVLPVGIFPGEA